MTRPEKMNEDKGIMRVKLEEVPEDAKDCARQTGKKCPHGWDNS